MKLAKIIIKIIGIFCLVEFIGGLVLLLFGSDSSTFFPFLFGTIFFGFLAFMLLRKPKAKINQNSQFPQEALVDMRKNYPRKDIPRLLEMIEESIQLVEKTTNVETLISRREFAFQKCLTLKQLEDCGLYRKKPTADEYLNRINKTSFNEHLKRCYDDYYEKAHQLKTEKGIQNRMDKFWSILEEHLDEYTIQDFKDTL